MSSRISKIVLFPKSVKSLWGSIFEPLEILLDRRLASNSLQTLRASGGFVESCTSFAVLGAVRVLSRRSNRTCCRWCGTSYSPCSRRGSPLSLGARSARTSYSPCSRRGSPPRLAGSMASRCGFEYASCFEAYIYVVPCTCWQERGKVKVDW